MVYATSSWLFATVGAPDWFAVAASFGGLFVFYLIGYALVGAHVKHYAVIVS